VALAEMCLAGRIGATLRPPPEVADRTSWLFGEDQARYLLAVAPEDLREVLGREDGAPPPVDLALERRHGDLVRTLIDAGAVGVVHDLSDGGLAAAAAEMALASKVGVRLNALPEAPHARLFGEDQARYLLGVADPAPVLAAAQAAGAPAAIVGQAEGDGLAVDGLFSLPLDRLRAAHEGWMPTYMGD